MIPHYLTTSSNYWPCFEISGMQSKAHNQGCTLTFFVHSTGATEADSFVAQAKNHLALLDISKISKNNHKQCSSSHKQVCNSNYESCIQGTHHPDLIKNCFQTMFFLYLHSMPSVRHTNKKCKSQFGSWLFSPSFLFKT